jgi:hypothetical protein
LKKIISRSAVLAAIGIAAPGWASGDSAAGSATANTILIKGGAKSLRFVAPKTIVAGEELTIENETKAKKVGPHTVSLVVESVLPKTRPERKKCCTPHHICKAIAEWHGVKGNGPPT